MSKVTVVVYGFQTLILQFQDAIVSNYRIPIDPGGNTHLEIEGVATFRYADNLPIFTGRALPNRARLALLRAGYGVTGNTNEALDIDRLRASVMDGSLFDAEGIGPITYNQVFEWLRLEENCIL